MSIAWTSGNAHRFIATGVGLHCDSGGWSGDMEEPDLICQSLSSLVLTSNYSMFFELKILITYLYLSYRINKDTQIFIELRYVL